MIDSDVAAMRGINSNCPGIGNRVISERVSAGERVSGVGGKGIGSSGTVQGFCGVAVLPAA